VEVAVGRVEEGERVGGRKTGWTVGQLVG